MPKLIQKKKQQKQKDGMQTNRIYVELIKNENDYLKWTSKPRYMSEKVINNDLVVIQKIKVTLILNKPAYVGMCILDLNKVLMYEVYYKNMVKVKDYYLLT